MSESASHKYYLVPQWIFLMQEMETSELKIKDLALPLTNNLTLGKLLNFSESKISHL